MDAHDSADSRAAKPLKRRAQLFVSKYLKDSTPPRLLSVPATRPPAPSASPPDCGQMWTFPQPSAMRTTKFLRNHGPEVLT